MSDITLSSVDALGDFLTNEIFEVSVVSLPTGFTGISSDEINLRCKSISIPDTPVEYMTVSHRTFTKSQPTHRNNYAEGITMQMVETTTPKTLPFLRDWMARCATKGTNYIYPPEMRQCELLVYLKRNDRTVAWVYNLKNCQITSKGDLEVGGDSASPVIPQLTFNSNLILEGSEVSLLD